MASYWQLGRKSSTPPFLQTENQDEWNSAATPLGMQNEVRNTKLATANVALILGSITYKM